MKKFITTKTNPLILPNMIFEADSIGLKILNNHYFDYKIIKLWIRQGYIKEVQKKEFTEDDMIGFHYWAGSVKEEEAKEDFNDWKKLK